MAILVNDLISRVQAVLQDTTGVRWPQTELVLWINDAQREVALLKPDAMSNTAIVTLDAGTKQSIPADGNRLLKVVRNMTQNANDNTLYDGKRSIRLVDGDILDSQTPDWHDSTVGGDAAHGSEVKHYIYNEESPRTYYVYPGVSSASTVYLEIMYSKNPAVLATITGSTTLSVPDIFGNAVMNYVLYMAYMKDSEYAGNQQRAANHYQLFSASVTGKAQIDTVSSPNVEASNPPNLQ